MRFSHANYKLQLFVSRKARTQQTLALAQIKRMAIRTGKIAVALPSIGFYLLFGEIAKLYAIRSINVPGNNGDLLFDGEVQVIKEFEL